MAKLIGFIVGLAIALSIAFIFGRRANTNGRVKTEYDERQKIIRGDAYRISFYVAVGYFILLLLMDLLGLQTLLNQGNLAFLGLILMCMVHCTYSILKGAYWGLNNNKKRYLWFLLCIALFNGIFPVMDIIHGEFIVTNSVGINEFSSSFINFVCSVFLLEVCIVSFVKDLFDKKADLEGEDD